MHQGRAQAVARALGWFSIGLGLAELIAPRSLARATGLDGRERLLQWYGAREIATGVAILLARDPKPWVTARVAGDALDIATLATCRNATAGSNAKAAAAMGAVAGVTALDAYTALSLRRSRARARTFDYSGRSGFRAPAASMRGAAAGKVKERRVERPSVGLRTLETPIRV
jgi:hypothetical protein